MPVKKLTPVLFVEKIESVLPFWTQHLGFIKTVEVPEGDRLAFVILQPGNAEIMYQSFASVDKDLPAIAADIRKGPTFLYLEVDDLATVKAATAGMDIYMPERTTFYGSREIGVNDPAGHFITFAHFEMPASREAGNLWPPSLFPVASRVCARRRSGAWTQEQCAISKSSSSARLLAGFRVQPHHSYWCWSDSGRSRSWITKW